MARIAFPVVVAVLIAVIAGGTAPWWWERVFPPVDPGSLVTAEASASDEPSPSADQPASEHPSGSEAPSASAEPSFLGMLQGEWTFETWQERQGAVTLCFHPLSGSLVVDSIGHASWDLEIDDCGPEPQPTSGLRCLGVVDASAQTLSHVTGTLAVNDEQLIGEERNWTSNLYSLRGDTQVAFCGSTITGTQLFVYETTHSDYSLTIATAGDGTPLLTMGNAAGTFTWRKLGA